MVEGGLKCWVNIRHSMCWSPSARGAIHWRVMLKRSMSIPGEPEGVCQCWGDGQWSHWRQFFFGCRWRHAHTCYQRRPHGPRSGFPWGIKRIVQYIQPSLILPWASWMLQTKRTNAVGNKYFRSQSESQVQSHKSNHSATNVPKTKLNLKYASTKKLPYLCIKLNYHKRYIVILF